MKLLPDYLPEKNCKLSLSMIEVVTASPGLLSGEIIHNRSYENEKDETFQGQRILFQTVESCSAIALQNLMLALVAAADALMLGRVDQNTMSAVSLATQIQFIQNMVLSSS